MKVIKGGAAGPQEKKVGLCMRALNLWYRFWEWRFETVRDNIVQGAAMLYIEQSGQLEQFVAFYMNKFPPSPSKRRKALVINLEAREVKKTALQFINAQGVIDDFCDWFDGIVGLKEEEEAGVTPEQSSRYITYQRKSRDREIR